MTWLIEPLQYAFFLRALLVGALLGVTCGALGCFVVLRGMAFIGDAMAHSVLPGVVEVPPQDPEYQVKVVPEPPMAVSVMVPAAALAQ